MARITHPTNVKKNKGKEAVDAFDNFANKSQKSTITNASQKKRDEKKSNSAPGDDKTSGKKKTSIVPTATKKIKTKPTKTIKQLKKEKLNPEKVMTTVNRVRTETSTLPFMLRAISGEKKLIKGKWNESAWDCKKKHTTAEELRLESCVTAKAGLEVNTMKKIPSIIRGSERRRFKEIIRQQKATNCAIPRARFDRLLREILVECASENDTPLRITKKAVDVMREAVESSVVSLMRGTAKSTIHRGRLTSNSDDMRFALSMDPTWDPVRHNMIRRAMRSSKDEEKAVLMDLV